jgi:DNA-binding response OmpR family regulator
MRILVIEDEPRILAFVSRGLEAEGFTVDAAGDGPDGLRRAVVEAYDLVVLDLLLPRLDGLAVLRELQQRRPQLPVVIVSARGDLETKLRGFGLGACDYVSKPFSFDELLARVRALLRRGAPPRPAVLEAGGLRLDPAAHRVWRGGEELAFTSREFALLETFMRRPGQVLSRFDLLEHVWDGSYENRSNVIEVYVGYLREKLGREAIETVRGAGYRLAVDDAAR